MNLEGASAELSTAELNGGARISFVFHEIFASAISAMDPFDLIKDVDIRTLLYNSAGATPSLFVGAGGFKTLIKGQIKRLDDPCVKCIALIYDELIRMINQLLQKPVFKRFPLLKERFYSSVVNFFKKCLDPTSKFVQGLVNAEAAYINTVHPDFLSSHKALAIVTEKMNANNPQSQTKDKKLAQGASGAPSPGAANATSLYPVASESESLFSTFQQKKPIRKPGVLDAPAAVLKATGSLSEREHVEIEIMKLLLTSYYNIVKRTIADMVPKIIMLNLVNYSKEEMQHALLADLYKKDISEEVLKESEVVASRRKEVKKMIEALHRADDIISTI
jgi:vacuolar protein sorting-associated protein 1